MGRSIAGWRGREGRFAWFACGLVAAGEDCFVFISPEDAKDIIHYRPAWYPRVCFTMDVRVSK